MTAAAWIDPEPPQRRPPRRMQVQVLLACGQRVQYEALFRHTFDAYDHAMERYPTADRVCDGRCSDGLPCPAFAPGVIAGPYPVRAASAARLARALAWLAAAAMAAGLAVAWWRVLA